MNIQNETDQDPFKKKDYSTLLIVFIGVCIIFASIYAYSMYHSKNNNLSSESPVNTARNDIKIDMVHDTSIDSTQQYRTELLEDLSTRSETAETKYERLSYMLQKGFTLVVNRTEVVDAESGREARTIFLRAYNETKDSSTPSGQYLSELALFGYIFHFAQNCFDTILRHSLPTDIRSAYFPSLTTGPDVMENIRARQKATFESIIAMIDSPDLFPTLRDDKIFNSHAVIIRATYLDSFKDEMTNEEIASVVQSIQSDLDRFNNGKFITAGGSQTTTRLTVSAPYNFAYADYVTKYVQGVQDVSQFDTAYNHIQNLQGDNMARAIGSSWIKMHKLGALSRDSSVTEQEIKSNVDAIYLQIQNRPEIKSVIKSNLTYASSDGGSWNIIRQDLFNLRNTSASVDAFLNDMGFIVS